MAVVVIAVVGQLLALGLVLGGVGAIVALAQRPGTEDPGTTDPGAVQEELEPGQVHDADGDPVEDGTGSRERPATPGEHGLSWPTWDGGTVTVRIEGIERGAALPSTGDAEPLAEGYELVLVTGAPSRRASPSPPTRRTPCCCPWRPTAGSRSTSRCPEREQAAAVDRPAAAGA